MLLRDALLPNLVQTLEGGPAFVHCGPFANIAHGCNSLVATELAMRLGDIVLTEAGFGSDLGAEKFFNIKCRAGDLAPEAAVITATVRALKLHGGASKDQLAEPDPKAVQRGFANLERHMKIVRQFGVPAVVALNRFVTDSDEELDIIRSGCEAAAAEVAMCEVWEKGGDGGIDVANAVLKLLNGGGAKFKPLYETSVSIPEKIEVIAKSVYGADGVDFDPPAIRMAQQLEGFGLGDTPICIAKTQYSLTDDQKVLGAPTGFRIQIRDIYPSAGAGFVVALAGDIMTMPGLGKVPAAERMRVREDGSFEGLF